MEATGHEELRVTVLRLARRIRAERATEDVTDAQLSVLVALSKHGPQTLGSLSELERISPPSANRTVNSLAELEFVTRSGSPDDGRKVHIVITGKGEQLLLETRRRRSAWLNDRMAALGPDQRRLIEAATPALRELADS